jgi:hypothetical protein
MILQFQSSDIVLVVQIFIISWCIRSTKSGLAFFISSDIISSIPGALLSLSFCIAFFTSSNDGIDLIQAELIKKASPDFVEHMHQLIIKIWTTETIPEDWNWSSICPIHKKGDVTICSNYRAISLLCAAYKNFSNILFNRLMPYVEATIGDYQCGYHQERSTVDQIFTVRQIL